MNVEIGAEAALFPEKEYIYGIFVAVWFETKRTQRLRGKRLFSFIHEKQDTQIVHTFTAMLLMEQISQIR
jgi:hypothetical protein